jgi:hypothetical protein
MLTLSLPTRVGASRPPRFLGDPCLHAVFSDPDELDAFEVMALWQRASMSPCGYSRGLGAHDEFISGPNLTAYRPAVYASQPRSPVYGHARLASRVTTSVVAGGTFTRGR